MELRLCDKPNGERLMGVKLSSTEWRDPPTRDRAAGLLAVAILVDDLHTFTAPELPQGVWATAACADVLTGLQVRVVQVYDIRVDEIVTYVDVQGSRG